MPQKKKTIIKKKSVKKKKSASSSKVFTDKNILDEIIRVDHAGEYGATRIYDGQIAVFGKDSKIGKTIQKKSKISFFLNKNPKISPRFCKNLQEFAKICKLFENPASSFCRS